MKTAASEVKTQWRTFRIDMQLATTYHKAQAARSGMPFGVPFHWIDELLYTLLFIRAMEIHDDAIECTLASRGEVPPKKYFKTLKGRLQYCTDHWSGFNGATLLRHADRRNEFGHEARQHADVRELKDCVNDVESSLIWLGCIPGPITVTIEYERISKPSNAPGRHSLDWHTKIFVNGAEFQVWRITEKYTVGSEQK